jgi:hypothetical protein
MVDPADPTGVVPYSLWRDLVALRIEPDLSNPNPNIRQFEPGSTLPVPKISSAQVRAAGELRCSGLGAPAIDFLSKAVPAAAK